MIDQFYDDIVRQYPQEVCQAKHFVDEAMRQRNCLFGGKPLPYFLKPYFLSEEQTEVFDQASVLLIHMLEKITRLYFERPELRVMFSLNKAAAALIDIDPGFERNIVISRPDAFLHDGSLQFIEFNCDSPAGAVYTDLEEDIFVEAFPLQKLNEKAIFKRYARKVAIFDALLSCYWASGGMLRRPNIAIMDWRDVKTVTEFELLKIFFEAQGCETVVTDPRDVRWVRGELRVGADGMRVDVIYRRAIFRELMEHIDEIQDLLKAYAAGKICMVNPLRSRLAANKCMLSILTNPAYDHLFTDQENEAKKKYIPWTRRVVDAEQFFGGKQGYLRDLILDHQQTMVLKPADSYGGRGVSIGCETSQEAWKQLTDQALLSEEDWVVQEFVAIPSMTVPIVEGTDVQIALKKVNVNPYVFNGRFAGGIARLSDASVINVSAGGGLVPTLTYKLRQPIEAN